MKSFGSIFLVLAFVLAALFVPGAGLAAEHPDKFWQLREEVARLHEAGSDGQALQLAKQALALAVQEFGPDSLQASNQTCGVGIAAEAAGDFAEATRQYAECVRVREIVSGRDSQLVAAGLEHLGHALFKQGRFAEAEARYSREIQIYRDLLGDEENVPPGAYSGLGAVKLARGEYGAALANYRKAVHRLTSRPAERVTNRSFVETQIREHRDIFIGLGRTAAALRLKPGADERGLMDESFAAGQRAWATSAASALVKMTARLKAGDTELGRSIRHLDELNERIQDLSQQTLDEAAALFKTNPAVRQGMEAMSVAGVALMKDMAPFIKGQQELAGVTKRQQELASRLSGLAKRCPTARGPECAESDRERIAIKKELSELSTKTSHAMKEQDLGKMRESARLALQQLASADKTIPGFADAGKVMKARNDESLRLERELTASREAVVKRFPEFLSLSDPAPLTVAETQKLLKEDEALIAILTGPESSLVWAVTSHGSDWAEIEAGEAALAAEVKALRAGLEPAAGGAQPSFDIARSHALYQLLLGRFAPVLAGKRHVMLVATGPLSSLPFHVLVTGLPRPELSYAEALKEARG
jgi:tetratricopeptide (TPR) repeat protein